MVFSQLFQLLLSESKLFIHMLQNFVHVTLHLSQKIFILNHPLDAD